MRYIIGIIVGIVIVLNWGSVKELFDGKLGQQQAAVAPQPAKAAEPAPPSQPDDIVAKGMSDAAADHAAN